MMNIWNLKLLWWNSFASMRVQNISLKLLGDSLRFLRNSSDHAFLKIKKWLLEISKHCFKIPFAALTRGLFCNNSKIIRALS